MLIYRTSRTSSMLIYPTSRTISLVSKHRPEKRTIEEDRRSFQSTPASYIVSIYLRAQLEVLRSTMLRTLASRFSLVPSLHRLGNASKVRLQISSLEFPVMWRFWMNFMYSTSAILDLARLVASVRFVPVDLGFQRQNWCVLAL